MRTPFTAMLGIALLLSPAERAWTQSYAFRNFGADAGVDAAQALALDGDGQLLIGTDDGLLRFDGRDVARIHLPGGHVAVQRLARTASGDVWALTQSARLVVLRGDGSVREVALPRALATVVTRARASRRLRVDSAGRVWISDPDGGLWSFDPVTTAWQRATDATAPVPVDFFFGRADTVWLALHDRVGTAVVEHGRVVRPTWRWTVRDVVFIRPLPGGRAWIGTGHGVFIASVGHSPRRVLGDDFAVWWQNEPASDSAGTLLLVGGHGDGALGLFELSADGTARLSGTDRPLLSDHVLRQELFDPEHGFWVAHDGGVSQLEQDYLVSYSLRTSSGVAEIPRDIRPDPFGRGLWVSTWGGLYRLQGARFERVSETARRATSAVVIARDSSVWWTEDVRSGFSLTGGERVAHADERGNVLFETADGTRYVDAPTGLVRIPANGGRETRVTTRRVTPALMAEGAGGRMWISSQFHGIDSIDGDSLGSECHACAAGSVAAASVAAVITALRDVDLRAMRADADGRVWIASFGGLICLWRDAYGVWRHIVFDRSSGLLSDDVSSVAPAAHGRLWVGTARGLQGFRIAAGVPTLPPTLQQTFELRARDGLDGENVTAVTEDAHGDVWFSPGQGRVYRLDDNAVPARHSPSVRVSRVEVDGVSQPAGASMPLHVRAGASTLGVQLSVRTLHRAAQVHIQYRLEPADTGWIDLGADRALRFEALSPGRHVLVARAVRPGEIPGPIMRLPIAATAPFYRLWWFPIVVTALLGAVALQWYRARMERRLALERLRTRIATDLHDDIGSGLTQISLYGELIRRESDARVGAWADAVGVQARQLSETMRDLVWAIDPARESWESLELRMKDWAAELVAPASVALDMAGAADAELVPLSADIRRNILLIFKEALHNAVRHAGCSRVEVRWHASHDSLSLRIHDDGRGFDTRCAAAAPGNGLRNIARRAAEIGAHVCVRSEPDAGTDVELRLPLRRASRVTAERRADQDYPSM